MLRRRASDLDMAFGVELDGLADWDGGEKYLEDRLGMFLGVI